MRILAHARFVWIVGWIGLFLLADGITPHSGMSQTTVEAQPHASPAKPQGLNISPAPTKPSAPLHERCRGQIDCYKHHLEQTINTQGILRALQVIDQIVAQDPVARSEAHNLTHHVGRTSYHHLHDVSAVMFECTAAHQSGCYHGALEAYLSSKPHVTPEDVVAICSARLEQEKGRFAYFNCFHGLGHGLTMHLNHDFKRALSMCDKLQTAWDQQSCYGGVFMETVVTGIRGPQQTHQHHGKAQDHHEMSQPPKLIDPKDPLYPCSNLETRYLRECYMMQTSIILHLTQYDVAKAFGECDKAPQDMQPTCYQSMGRDISGHTLRDIRQSIALCELGGATYQGRCFVGVVKNFLNVSGHASDNAFEFCQQTPERHKKDCHFAIGEELLTLYATVDDRSRECARSEKSYIHDCRLGARLPPGQS
ncbi:MAG: hypothetical protein MRJ96_06755 [Nitrospirales bacterium]|nr:hypothetical protein [Nitrospira sp.]MDR4501134.1 hypothetical protein [Nitrospirales bacterium]